MKIKTIIPLFLLFLSTSLQASINVWIDYDVSFGKRFSDVDDAIALIAAINTPHLNVVGISYSFGNTDDLDHMEKITNEILNRYNKKQIPFYRGAAAAGDIDKQTAATRALSKVLKEKKITILSMGRMTTVASLIKNQPNLISNIEQVIVNFGRRLETETKVGALKVIMPDTNVDGDIEATRVLTQSRVKIVLIPTELMFDQFVTIKHMNLLKNGTNNARWLRKNFKIWKKIWAIYPATRGFIPWDLFIVGYLTNPLDFYCDEEIPIDFKLLKNNTSRFIDSIKKPYKHFVVASYNLNSKNKGVYCYDVNDLHITQWVEKLSEL